MAKFYTILETDGRGEARFLVYTSFDKQKAEKMFGKLMSGLRRGNQNFKFLTGDVKMPATKSKPSSE